MLAVYGVTYIFYWFKIIAKNSTLRICLELTWTATHTTVLLSETFWIFFRVHLLLVVVGGVL